MTPLQKRAIIGLTVFLVLSGLSVVALIYIPDIRAIDDYDIDDEGDVKFKDVSLFRTEYIVAAVVNALLISIFTTWSI